MPRVRLFAPVVSALGAVIALILGAATPAGATSSPNTVAAHPWGIYKGSGDGLWPAYEHSTGNNHRLLGKMALHARVRSYGSWIPTDQVGGIISKDISQEQAGNPNVLVWIELFRLWPHEESNNHQPLSASDQQAYRNWIDAAANAIGSTPVGIILEPDFPLTLVSWGPKVRAALVKYAAQRLSQLPNAAVYIDGGSADWLPASQLVKLLISGGVQYARGFDLGASHHDSTAMEIRYGRSVAQGLAAKGYADKHFVVDTSDNGQPYTNQQFYAKYPKSQGYNSNNPPACQTKRQHVCVSLGIPPTTDVTNPKWRLPSPVVAAAAKYVDAYVWIGHPWKINNGHDFDLQHALAAARTDPFF